VGFFGEHLIESSSKTEGSYNQVSFTRITDNNAEFTGKMLGGLIEFEFSKKSLGD
jgi:hypothetical protein